MEKKSIGVLGAGPKAAAISAKAAALRKVGKADIEVVVFEARGHAAHWTGAGGYTDGSGINVTPPEKDVGFPYQSRFGAEVDDFLVQNFSWAAQLISRTAYANWIDLGCPRPSHRAWAHYIEWVLGRAEAQTIPTRVISIDHASGADGRLRVNTSDWRGREQSYPVDGFVFTGPGPSRPPGRNATVESTRVDDAVSYWLNKDTYAKMGKVAVIGSGETCANVVMSLLELSAGLKVEIVNRHGALFSRGESYFENRLYSTNAGWPERSVENRADIMKRLDRGSVSAKSLARLSEHAGRVSFKAGGVTSLLDDASTERVVLTFEGTGINSGPFYYDRVVNANGFEGSAALGLLASDLRPELPLPLSDNDASVLPIDAHLRLVTSDRRINIHVPMLAGVSQGPGIPGLSSLGSVADMILATYV